MSIISLILLAVTALAESVQLYVTSSNTEIDGLGLISLNEGAGISYMFVNETGEVFDYEASNGTLTRVLAGSILQYFTELDGAAFMTVPPINTTVSFVSDLLVINGYGRGFYACKNTGDQYRYSESYWELMYYPDGDAPSGCSAVQVFRNGLVSGGDVGQHVSLGAPETLTQTHDGVTVTFVVDKREVTGEAHAIDAPETLTITANGALETVVVGKRGVPQIPDKPHTIVYNIGGETYTGIVLKRGFHQSLGAPETLTVTNGDKTETIVVDKRDVQSSTAEVVSTFLGGAGRAVASKGIFALILGILLAFM